MTTYRKMAESLNGNTLEARLAFVGEWLAGDGTSCAEMALQFPDYDSETDFDDGEMSDEWTRREEIRIDDEAHWAEWNQKEEAAGRAAFEKIQQEGA